MIELILVGLIFVAFFVGFFLRKVLDILIDLKDALSHPQTPQNEPKAPPAIFVEPAGISEILADEEQERIAKLNP